MEDFFYKFLSSYNHLPYPAKKTLGSIYHKIPSKIKYGPFYFEYRKRLEFFNSLNTFEEVEYYQNEILKEQINATIASVPFYKGYKKFTSLDDLREYPVLNKTVISHDINAFLNPGLARKRIKTNTGGSSGNPLEFYLEKDSSRTRERAHFDWYWGLFGYKPGDRILMVRGTPISGNKPFEYRTIDKILNISSFNLNENNIVQVLDAINRFSPRFIHAYPSSLNVMTSLLEPFRLKLDFLPGALFLGSEFLSETDRMRFEAFYKAPAVNWYGHSERLILGGNLKNCDSYHFFPSYGYMELLNDDGEVITRPGEEGRIIATGFDNRVMPFIRYDTGDTGILSRVQDCSCGFRGKTLEIISGRRQDFIILSDGTKVSLTAFIFGQHLPAFKKIREMQVIQHKAGEIELALVKNNNFSLRDEISVVGALRKLVKDKLEIKVIYVESVSKTPRGKNIFFVTELNP